MNGFCGEGLANGAAEGYVGSCRERDAAAVDALGRHADGSTGTVATDCNQADRAQENQDPHHKCPVPHHIDPYPYPGAPLRPPTFASRQSLSNTHKQP